MCKLTGLKLSQHTFIRIVNVKLYATLLQLLLLSTPLTFLHSRQNPVINLEGEFLAHTTERAYFNSPVTTYNSVIYLAYIDRNLQLRVAKKEENFWQESIVDSVVYPSTWHSAASIGIDESGFVHVVGNMHSTPWQYHRSKVAEDISQWEFLGQFAGSNKGHTVPGADVRATWMTEGNAAIPGNQITYPFLCNDRRGRLFVAFRECFYCDRSDYFSREWSAGIAKYDARKRRWRRVGGARTWAHDTGFVPLGLRLAFDARNRMHVSWLWYAHYKKDRTHDKAPNFPAYALSPLAGDDFQRSDLQPLSLPVDFSQTDTLWSPFALAPNSKGYFERYTDIAIAPNGSPYVVLFPKSPSAGRKRSFTTYVPGFGWTKPEPMPWAATRLLIDDNGMMTAISSGVRIHRKKISEKKWKTYTVDLSLGGCLVTVDYRYFQESGNLRIYAVQNRSGNPVKLRVYTVFFPKEGE